MERSAAAVVLLALCTLYPAQTEAQLTPEDRCPVHDAALLSRCVANGLEKLRPFLRTGIPEHDIPPGDPLFLDQLHFSRHGLEAKYSNIIVHGFSAFQLRSLNVDPSARSVTFDLSVPEVNLAGNYDIKGTFLVLVVTSSGNFSSQLKGVHVMGTGDLVLRTTPDEKRQVQMGNLVVHLEIGEANHQIDFNSDTNPIIGQTVRHLVTHNDRILLDEVRPEIEKKVAQLMMRLVNRVLTVIPVDALLDAPAPAGRHFP